MLWFRKNRQDLGPPDSCTKVQLQPVGRSGAGKTALYKMLYKGPLQTTLPSGLRLGVTDPRRMAEIIRNAQDDYDRMRRESIISTVEPEEFEFSLLEAGQERIRFRVREAIGQLVSEVTPGSAPILQSKFNSFLNDVATADVVWQIVPCPPSAATIDDAERLRADTLLTLTATLAALSQRRVPYPAALALVVTKCDARYQSEEDARARMPKEFFRWLQHQVRDLVQSPRLSDVAAFPVTAYGWGMAQPKDSPVVGEIEWILKPGSLPRPFGLTPLVVFSLIAGLRNKEVDGNRNQVMDLVRILRLLEKDLESLPGCWYVPLKED